MIDMSSCVVSQSAALILTCKELSSQVRVTNHQWLDTAADDVLRDIYDISSSHESLVGTRVCHAALSRVGGGDPIRSRHSALKRMTSNTQNSCGTRQMTAPNASIHGAACVLACGASIKEYAQQWHCEQLFGVLPERAC